MRRRKALISTQNLVCALEDFAKKLQDDISSSLESFLSSGDTEDRVGTIRLEEIFNTKTTLYITELYLT